VFVDWYYKECHPLTSLYDRPARDPRSSRGKKQLQCQADCTDHTSSSKHAWDASPRSPHDGGMVGPRDVGEAAGSSTAHYSTIFVS